MLAWSDLHQKDPKRPKEPLAYILLAGDQSQFNRRIRTLEPELKALQRDFAASVTDSSEVYHVLDTNPGDRAREYGIPVMLVFQEIEFAVIGISAEGWQVWH